MVAYSERWMINQLQSDADSLRLRIDRYQSMADSLPDGEQRDFYLWRIKQCWQDLEEKEQEIVKLKQRLRFYTLY